MIRRLVPSVCVLGLFCGVANAQAATLYAYANGTGTPAGCGTESMSSSGCSLATALSDAAAGDTVMLATPGASAGGSNYVGNWSIGTTGTSSGAPVTIDGSGVSDATLDGNLGSATGCTTTACNGPVLTVTNSMFLVIKDLTIQNGDNISISVGVGGGGIQNDNGGTVTITGSTFSGNTAANGGAVDSGDDGGLGTVKITGSTFTGNTAGSDGGAVDNGDDGGSGTATITGSTFTGNTADFGGAVDNGDGRPGSGTATITGSTFTGNTAANGGAVDSGDNSGSGTATITGSTFTGNTATNDGGAVDNGDEQGSGTATITDSTFSGGSATDGGEIDTSDGFGDATLVLAGSTLAAKAASPDVTGGSNSGSGSVYVAGDVFASGCQQTAGTWTDEGYNAGADTSCFKSGPGDVNAGSAAALNLGSLAANGGLTETLALGSGSKALGIIPSPTQVTLNSQQVELCNGAGSDQRGDPRPGTGKAACDAGAFETQLPTLYAYAGGASTSSGCPQTSTAGEQCSLGRALSLAAAGDTVELATPAASSAGSNYVGNWSIGTTGTSSGAPVTIDGSGVSDATLDGNMGSATGCTTTACDGPVLTVANSMFLVIKDLTIQNGDNTASGQGGAIQNLHGGTATITGSTFTDNSASGPKSDGGAIDNADAGSGTVSISASTFSGDSATDGGEIDTSDNNGTGTLVVSGSTFSAGSGPDLTAGRNSGSGSVYVAGDVFAAGCQQNGGTWNDEGHNAGADASCFNSGTGDVNAGSAAALNLGSLAANGGPTETIALGGDSPAAEIIPNPTMVTLNGSQVALCPGSDQRGVARPQAGVRDCDAGAYETQPVAPSVRITAPGDGDSYGQGSKIMADYSCAEGNNGPELVTGSAGCQGTVANGASIDTGTAGAHAFRVTAASRDGLTTTITVHYAVIGPPVNRVLPEISGTALPGDKLSCSQGSWTNSPTGFSYQWSSGGEPIAGATNSSYIVRIADETHTLTCTVIASSTSGKSQPAVSEGVLVANTHELSCARPSGAIAGTRLGPLVLGMTLKQAERILPRFVKIGFGYTNFCLYAGFGIRVALPSSLLLSELPAVQRNRVNRRIIIALTANKFYALDGIVPGELITKVPRKLHLEKPFQGGANTWYFVPGKLATGVLKVRHGLIYEIGIADKALTSGSRASQRKFFTG